MDLRSHQGAAPVHAGGGTGKAPERPERGISGQVLALPAQWRCEVSGRRWDENNATLIPRSQRSAGQDSSSQPRPADPITNLLIILRLSVRSPPIPATSLPGGPSMAQTEGWTEIFGNQPVQRMTVTSKQMCRIFRDDRYGTREDHSDAESATEGASDRVRQKLVQSHRQRSASATPSIRTEPHCGRPLDPGVWNCDHRLRVYIGGAGRDSFSRGNTSSRLRDSLRRGHVRSQAASLSGKRELFGRLRLVN